LIKFIFLLNILIFLIVHIFTKLRTILRLADFEGEKKRLMRVHAVVVASK